MKKRTNVSASERMKKLHKNPEFQARRIAGIKKFNDNLPDDIRKIRSQNGLSNKGKKRTPEQIKTMIEAGRKVSPPNPKNRTNSYHRQWRRDILERDIVCQICGESDKSLLEAHHILTWEHNEDKRLDLDNGICLCKKCHRIFDNLLALFWIEGGRKDLKKYYKDIFLSNQIKLTTEASMASDDISKIGLESGN